MNRTERLQRLDELAGADSDLDPFSAERMEFSELLFLELKDVLNEVHGMNASLRFWKLVAEDHLLAEVVRKDTLREKGWSGSPEMYAVVNFSNFPTRAEKLRNIGGHVVRHLKSRNFKAEIDRNIRLSNDIYIGFGGLPVPEANSGSTTIVPRYYPLVYGYGKNRKRKTLNRIADKYDSLFLRNVIRRIPKVYVEYFHKLYNTVEVFELEIKTLHVHMTDSLFEKMMIAKYTEKGSKLIWYQHGCYYGEVVHKYRGYFEHSTGDVFRTWGYRDHGIDEPWSAYRLEAFKQKIPQNGVGIDYDLMICYAAMGRHNRERIHDITCHLLKRLDKDKYQRIMARPRPANSRVKTSSQLDFITDERVVIATDGSNIARQVAESRVVFQMRVPATNFLECIYCDQPVVGLLENDQPTEIVKPYYTFFLREGILHNDIESAAQFLNELDVELWWSRIVKSPEYKSYKREFTNSDQFKNAAVR